MQFLVVLRRRTEAFSAEQFSALLEPEAQAARALYQDGFTRQIWSRGDEPGAVLLVEAADVEEVKRCLRSLPLYEQGMLETQVITQLNPYRGFAPR
jgi:muconolactone delta-isomerase